MYRIKLSYMDAEILRVVEYYLSEDGQPLCTVIARPPGSQRWWPLPNCLVNALIIFKEV